MVCLYCVVYAILLFSVSIPNLFVASSDRLMSAHCLLALLWCNFDFVFASGKFTTKSEESLKSFFAVEQPLAKPPALKRLCVHVFVFYLFKISPFLLKKVRLPTRLRDVYE